jgi:hypothetical protein
MRDGDSARQCAASMYSLRFLDERGAAHGPRVVRPLHGDERGDDLARALPQHGDQDQRDQDRRERELDVDDAHDERLDAAADVRGREPHREPDGERQHRRRRCPRRD